MRKKIILGILILFAVIFLRFLFSVINTHINNEKMKKVSTPEVIVSTVKTKDIIRSYEAPARVISRYRVDVVSRINGYLLKSNFKEGDYVKAGQILFEIEPQEYQYAMQQAEITQKDWLSMV